MSRGCDRGRIGAKRGTRRQSARKTETNDDDGFAAWGGYFAAKKAKLLDQFRSGAAEKLSDIFNGVEILVNGHTHPRAEDLKDLMAVHGGTYHMYPSSKVTHIIASNLPNVKIKHLGSVPVVKPAWITESIDFGKLLDYKRYLLYTNQSTAQPALNFPVLPKDIPSTFIDNTSVISNLQEPYASTSAAEENKGLRTTKTASDPRFLEEFYNNSRLHLISTLGAEFKLLVGQLREKFDGKFPGLEKLKAEKGKAHFDNVQSIVVMHIDMDCFFVSVGLKNHPELKGKPVAITHARNGQINSSNPDIKAIRDKEFELYSERLPEGATSRIVDVKERLDEKSSMSEIASCSYEARKFGIKNGMFLGMAVKLCPDLKTLPYDFQGYKEVSHSLYQTIASYTLDIEAVSCDEMYVDVTKILKETGLSVEEWASHIRSEITGITGCPCSTGFGANRLQARLATRKAKPNGQYYLQCDDVESYMSEIPLADLPGVGRATLAKLKNLGLSTCGDVQLASLKQLQQELGSKIGETIRDQSRGIDNKPLNYNHERKSVSAEINYGIRFKTVDECHNFLQSLSNEVYNRLAEINMRARCLTLKLLVRAKDAPVETAKFLGHGVCDAVSKSTTSNSVINDPIVIYREAKMLYEKLNIPFFELRGVGIQLSKLEKNVRMNNALSDFLKQADSKQKIDTSNKQETKLDDVDCEQKLHTTEVQIQSHSIAVGAENITDKKTSNKSDKMKQAETKKTRGRPKGGSTAKKKNISKKGVQNTLNVMFNNKSQHSQRRSSFVQSLQPQISIDLDVLGELPEDIRNEIIKEYQLENKLTQSQTKHPQCAIKQNDNNAVKPTSDRASTSQQTQKKTTKKKSHFDGLTWEQVKPIIKLWIQSETEPSDSDIEMLADYFRKMAIDRKIETLKVAYNFLHRVFSTLNCDWHKAYFQMLNIMQEGMVARYGNTLLVKREFRCCTI